MSSNLPAYTFARLNNKDEALRIILLILIRDPSYQMLPMRQIHTFYASISNDNYLLLLSENKVLGVMLWMGVSAKVKEDCLREDRSPYTNELVAKGEAIYCTAFSGIEPGVLLPLWKQFIKIYQRQDILFKRHFKKGERKSKPIALIRQQRLIKVANKSL